MDRTERLHNHAGLNIGVPLFGFDELRNRNPQVPDESKVSTYCIIFCCIGHHFIVIRNGINQNR